jgi:hypothetical protein
MLMTLKAAQATLREIGISLRRTGWGRELRVNLRCGREETACYTDDTDDAVGTGQAMARQRDEAATAFQVAALKRRERT